MITTHATPGDPDTQRVMLDGLAIGSIRPCGPSWNRSWCAALPSLGWVVADCFPSAREAIDHLVAKTGLAVTL